MDISRAFFPRCCREIATGNLYPHNQRDVCVIFALSFFFTGITYCNASFLIILNIRWFNYIEEKVLELNYAETHLTIVDNAVPKTRNISYLQFFYFWVHSVREYRFFFTHVWISRHWEKNIKKIFLIPVIKKNETWVFLIATHSNCKRTNFTFLIKPRFLRANLQLHVYPLVAPKKTLHVKHATYAEHLIR